MDVNLVNEYTHDKEFQRFQFQVQIQKLLQSWEIVMPFQYWRVRAGRSRRRLKLGWNQVVYIITYCKNSSFHRFSVHQDVGSNTLQGDRIMIALHKFRLMI